MSCQALSLADLFVAQAEQEQAAGQRPGRFTMSIRCILFHAKGNALRRHWSKCSCFPMASSTNRKEQRREAELKTAQQAFEIL